MLAESLRAGATQVVILGAGLDSRAYRFGEALRGVRVFELDLPQTQTYKKARVRDLFGALPAHVTYAPIDFATQDLATVLNAAGYDPAKRTLFIWEGVTMYVPEAGIDATLRAVATNAARGSRIVFDYFTEPALRDRQSVLVPIAKNVAAVGEPFVFGVPGDNAAAFVRARGFSVVSDFGSAELAQKYLPEGVRHAVAICQSAMPGGDQVSIELPQRIGRFRRSQFGRDAINKLPDPSSDHFARSTCKIASPIRAVL